MASMVRRFTDRGPLQELLLRACPPMKRVNKVLVYDENGNRSIPILAKSLGMSAWGVQRWIYSNKIPARRVQEIVDNSRGAVTVDDLLPYVI